MWKLKCRLGDKWSSGWKASSCWLVKPASRGTAASRWGYMKGVQRRSWAGVQLSGDVAMAARLLLLLASISIPGAAIDSCLASLSWPEKQTSHQNSLSAANMSRRSTPVCRCLFFFLLQNLVFITYLFIYLFFAAAVFQWALQTSVGHNCLSEPSAEAAFLGRGNWAFYELWKDTKTADAFIWWCQLSVAAIELLQLPQVRVQVYGLELQESALIPTPTGQECRRLARLSFWIKLPVFASVTFK